MLRTLLLSVLVVSLSFASMHIIAREWRAEEAREGLDHLWRAATHGLSSAQELRDETRKCYDTESRSVFMHGEVARCRYSDRLKTLLKWIEVGDKATSKDKELHAEIEREICDLEAGQPVIDSHSRPGASQMD